MTAQFSQLVAKQKQADRYRNTQAVTPLPEGKVKIAGKVYLNFSANDYLGLNHHPEINKALQQGVDKFGLDSTGSSLISGYHYAHQALEDVICDWLNMPACLLFSSGFAANCGLLNTLAEHSEYGFYLDKLSHASIIDGIKHQPKRFKRFQHNNMVHAKQLIANAEQNPLIISEGVFSMDGDQAPIDEIAELARLHQGLSMIDDAHGIGVLGQQGAGSCTQNKVDIITGTFGKAIATSGAFIACSSSFREFLVNFCRHYIYSTAISPAMAWATIKAIELVKADEWRREKIQHLTHLFKQKLGNTVQLIASNSAIQAIIVGSEQNAISLSQKLKQDGIWLAAIRPPTVPNGKSRLRVTITAAHNDKDINYLTEKLIWHLNS